jgi:hypothetical protein
MASAFPSGSNTFVPSFDATGSLTVGFAKNTKDFAINKYISITNVKKTAGYYLQLNTESAARVTDALINSATWHDGQDAPTGEWEREAFEFRQYATQRYAFPFRIGYRAADQADWKIVASHAAMAAQRAMTSRASRVIDVLQAPGAFPVGNDITCVATQSPEGQTPSLFLNAGDSGDLNQGTSKGPALKRALNWAARKVLQNTLGVVKKEDLSIVINPNVADALSRSKELHTYLKESPAALAQVRGDADSLNGEYGLPDKIYGYKIIIEDTVKVTQKKRTGRNQVIDPLNVPTEEGFILGDNLLMLARPGQLEALEGGQSFSTCHIFAYEEMTVEQRDDPDNRRIAGRVVEDYDVQIVAPVTGFIFRNCIGG